MTSMTNFAPRDYLLIQADKVFNAFGYRHTSMGEIARVAGVSRQGLYHHFANKPQLFAAVIEMVHADTINEAAAARDAARTGGAGLEDVVTAMLDARFGELLRAVMGSPHHDELLDEISKRCADVVTAHAIRFHKMLIEVIQDEIDSGRFRLADDVRPDDLALAFATIARGINIKQPPPNPGDVRDDYARHVRLILRGAGVLTPQPDMPASDHRCRS
jgi:AcrR family transcriptional regulator